MPVLSSNPTAGYLTTGAWLYYRVYATVLTQSSSYLINTHTYVNLPLACVWRVSCGSFLFLWDLFCSSDSSIFYSFNAPQVTPPSGTAKLTIAVNETTSGDSDMFITSTGVLPSQFQWDYRDISVNSNYAVSLHIHSLPYLC